MLAFSASQLFVTLLILIRSHFSSTSPSSLPVFLAPPPLSITLSIPRSLFHFFFSTPPLFHHSLTSLTSPPFPLSLHFLFSPSFLFISFLCLFSSLIPSFSISPLPPAHSITLLTLPPLLISAHSSFPPNPFLLHISTIAPFVSFNSTCTRSPSFSTLFFRPPLALDPLILSIWLTHYFFYCTVLKVCRSYFFTLFKAEFLLPGLGAIYDQHLFCTGHSVYLRSVITSVVAFILSARGHHSHAGFRLPTYARGDLQKMLCYCFLV